MLHRIQRTCVFSAIVGCVALAQVAGPNVNMVSGLKLPDALIQLGYATGDKPYFDTLRVQLGKHNPATLLSARSAGAIGWS